MDTIKHRLIIRLLWYGRVCSWIRSNIPRPLIFVCLWRNSPPVGQGLLIHEVYRSHSITHQSVGLLWKSDQLVAANLYLTTHNTHNRQTFMPRRDSTPQYQQASGRRPTPYTTAHINPFQPSDAMWNNTFNSVLHTVQFLGAGKG
jgi:hypothetical protein